MRYLRPDESVLDAPVTGAVDADFQASWLTDGRFGFPVKKTGALSLTVSPGSPASSVDLIALCHHNIQASATVTLGGSLSGGITPAAVPADGIPLNCFRLLTSPVSVSSIVLGVTGNGTDVVIGELYAGLSRTLESPLRLGRKRNTASPFSWEDGSLINPYDTGIADTRRITGDCVLTEDGLADVEAWYASTRRGTRPTLIIPDDDINDAWVATFRFDAEDLAPGVVGEALFAVSFEIVEIPRVRW